MATLGSYITECRRLLHDANAVFWTDTELTDYINGARQRIVRDTGCLRVLQTTQAPTTPIAGGSTPSAWAANTAVSLSSYVFSDIFIYEVTTAGTTGDTAPPYPSASYTYPPSAAFTNGTAGLTYAGPAEIINYAALPEGTNTLDVLNINLYWGNTRIPLRYMPWTQFNAELRFWQNYIGRPIAYTTYGQGQLYLAPVPDQTYTIDLDTVVLPDPLVASTDVDDINDPYTTPVAYYACYTAKFKEQSFGEAEIFKQQYTKMVQAVLTSTFTRRLPTPYSTPY